MRDLSATLLSAQEELNLEVRVKITLSLVGETDIILKGGYPQQSGDRIKKIQQHEHPYSVYAKEVELDNSDGYFTNLDLKGWKAVASWGVTTSEGEEYSNTPPMRVVWQQFSAQPGYLTCYITLKGIPDLMDDDKASVTYKPDDTDTTTIKSLIDQIAGATITCFDHCKAYTTVWETGYDDIVDTYQPKKSFRIYKGGSRLIALKRLIEYSQNVFVWRDDGTIHIRKPISTGTDFDSEYSIDSGHVFLSKAFRQTLPIPNRVVVASEPDDNPQYSGSAQTSGYDALPDEVQKTRFIELTVGSNEQATSIAEAMLAKAEFNAEQGGANVPINVGAELYDYVKVGALNKDDIYRVGNVGWLLRTWDASKEDWSMQFGFGDPPNVENTRDLYSALAKMADYDFDRLRGKTLWVEDLWADEINIFHPETGQATSLAEDGMVVLDKIYDGIHSKLLTTAISAGKVKLSADGVDTGFGFNLVATTSIESGKIIVAGLADDAVGRIFSASSAKDAVEAWRHASDVTMIDGGKVYVKSLTFDKLISNPAYNLCENPGFETGDITGWSFPEGGNIDSSGSGRTGYYAGYQYVRTALREVTNVPIACVPDEIWSASCWVKDYESPNGTCKATLRWYDKDLTWLSCDTSEGATPTGAWQQISVTGKAPANTVYVIFGFAVESNASPQGYWGFDDCELVKASQIIVHGTPGAQRIEITGDEIAGYDSGSTKQFYLQASDGKAYAGGGSVLLDSSGLKAKGTGDEIMVCNKDFSDVIGKFGRVAPNAVGISAFKAAGSAVYLDVRNSAGTFKSVRFQGDPLAFVPGTGGEVDLGETTSRWVTLYTENINANSDITFANLPTSNPGIAGRLWRYNEYVQVSLG